MPAPARFCVTGRSAGTSGKEQAMFDKSKATYDAPKNTASEQTRQWRDFVIVGRDNAGHPAIVSTLSKDQTESLIREAAPGLVKELAE